MTQQKFRIFSVDANQYEGTIQSKEDLKALGEFYSPEEYKRMREHEIIKGTFGFRRRYFNGITLGDYLEGRDLR